MLAPVHRARRIADSYYVEACSKTSTMKTRRQMRSTCQERHTFQDSIHACDVDPGHCPISLPDRYIMLSGWLSQVSIRTIWASSSSSGLLQLIWHQSFDGAAPLACEWCRQSWVQFLTKMTRLISTCSGSSIDSQSRFFKQYESHEPQTRRGHLDSS